MKKEFAKAKSAMNQIQDALDGFSMEFGDKVGIALQLLEVSLETLSDLGLLTKLSIELEASLESGGRMAWKYSLGSRDVEGDDGEIAEVTYIKKSTLEEYE